MRLTPTEQQRLLPFGAARLARVAADGRAAPGADSAVPPIEVHPEDGAVSSYGRPLSTDPVAAVPLNGTYLLS